MNKPVKIILQDNEYYLGEDIYEYDVCYFRGCINVRDIIKKKKLQMNDYIYAYKKKDQWVISKENYARAKLLITTKWVEDNLPKDKIQKVENEYNKIRRCYTDDQLELTVEKDNLINELQKMKMVIEMKDKEMTMMKQIYEQQIEIYKLKAELAEMRK